jgi:hypothetical protein
MDEATWITHPSFVEQMARRHYEATDANAHAVPWDHLDTIRRQILVRAAADIVDRTIDSCVQDDEEEERQAREQAGHKE